MKINTPEEAIEQIREKTIRSALSAMRLSIKEQQSEGVLLVGIGYDKETKKHRCKIEEIKLQ
mgnify:CR=1 FL=1